MEGCAEQTKLVFLSVGSCLRAFGAMSLNVSEDSFDHESRFFSLVDFIYAFIILKEYGTRGHVVL